MITRDELAKLLNYDPDTGVWTWRINHGRGIAGAVAGSINGQGYREIKLRPAWIKINSKNIYLGL